MKHYLFVCLFLWSLSSYAADLSIELNKSNKSLRVTSAKGVRVQPLKIPQGMAVESPITVVRGEGVAVSVIPVADHELATALIYVFDEAGKLLWSLDTEAFNPSTPLIEKKHIYLAAIGKVYKLDKMTGKTVWKHDGLYEKKNVQFNGGTDITRQGINIQFAKNLLVDDASGKIREAQQ